MTKTANLDALLAAEGEVTLDGAAHAVQPMRGRHYQALMAMQRSGQPDLELLYRIAGACVPTLSEERVLDLTLAQLNAILQVASEGIAEVEATAPKATATPEPTPAP